MSLNMQRLKISSEKRQTFTRGKNKQEDSRLRVVKNILEKTITSYNTKHYREKLETQKILDEIHSTTNIVDEEKDNSDDSMLSFSTAYKSVTYAPSKSITSNYSRGSRHIRSTFSTQSQNEFVNDSFVADNSRFTIAKFNEIDNLPVDSETLYNRSIRSCKLKEINREFVTDGINSLDFSQSMSIMPDSTINTKVTINTSEDYEIKRNQYYPASRAISCHNEDSRGFKCGIFPCKLLRSYTSMIDETKDRKENQLRCVGFKSVINERLTELLRKKEPSKYRFSESSGSKRDIKIELKEDLTQNKFFKSENEYLIRVKSIRRPVKKVQSTNTDDLLFKIRSLQAKVKYVRDQNSINFVKTDRNIRYGDPPPRSNINRQMRILSQFDS